MAVVMKPIIVPEKFVFYSKPDGSSDFRPIREQAYMIHAAEMAKQATCDRLHVGAVFTDDKMMRVLCSGYNGSYTGGPNGCDSSEPGNCFPGDTYIDGLGIKAISRRRYSGKIFRIVTMTDEFTVTPNHPILVAGRGWVSARLLGKGDNLLNPIRAKRGSAVTPNTNHGITLEQAFNALDLVGFPVRKETVGSQFHGDGFFDQKIDIVSIDGRLRLDQNVPVAKLGDEPFFAAADHAHRDSACCGALAHSLGRVDHCLSFVGGHAVVVRQHGFADVSQTRVGFHESQTNNGSSDAVSLGERLLTFPAEVSGDEFVDWKADHRLSLVSAKDLGRRFQCASTAQSILDNSVRNAESVSEVDDLLAGFVTTNQIIDIQEYFWSGHVYNLSTSSNWFCVGASSNIVHNCGCIHGEVNALTKSREDLHGSICFVTTQPCKMCAKILVNRGVSRVVYLESYRNDEGLVILRASGIVVVKYADLPG